MRLFGTLTGSLVRGYSAYEIAVMNGFEGTEEEWITSLMGDKGDPGEGVLKYVKDDASDNSGVIIGNVESNRATGYASLAEGSGTKATGSYSHAEGYLTEAQGTHAHSEGYGTKATGQGAHSEGVGSVASGLNSHAENASTASGNYSHAEGSETVASGIYSHAEGHGTIASSDNQHVQGKYNVADSNDTYALIIGNGTSDSARSNAFAIKWDGTLVFANGTEITPAQFAQLLTLLS